ncbi:MAG: hypothetical protein ACPGRX_06995, partial [Bdellovibrionales bacterium]
ALTPVVWQMDLDQVKASALEVLRNEDKNCFTLTLKTPKGETLDAATFETREDAVEGLMAASKALQDAHGRIRGTQIAANDQNRAIAAAHASRPKGSKTKWVVGIACVLLLVVLFGLMGSMAPQGPNSFQQPASQTAQIQGQSAAESAGVAVNADDFLNGL